MMSMTSGIVSKAFSTTSVSSQSLMFFSSKLHPESALIISALFEMLFEAGSVAVTFSVSGPVMVYVVMSCLIFCCKGTKKEKNHQTFSGVLRL